MARHAPAPEASWTWPPPAHRALTTPRLPCGCSRRYAKPPWPAHRAARAGRVFGRRSNPSASFFEDVLRSSCAARSATASPSSRLPRAGWAGAPAGRCRACSPGARGIPRASHATGRRLAATLEPGGRVAGPWGIRCRRSSWRCWPPSAALNEGRHPVGKRPRAGAPSPTCRRWSSLTPTMTGSLAPLHYLHQGHPQLARVLAPAPQASRRNQPHPARLHAPEAARRLLPNRPWPWPRSCMDAQHRHR